MTTIEHDSLPLAGVGAQRQHFRLLQKIADLLAALHKRRERKRAFQHLSTLDPHLLRDIGFIPEDMRDAATVKRALLLYEPIRLPYEDR